MAAQTIDVLTPREREILVYIAQGDSLPEIAQHLHRSLKTIETHRLAIGRKLNASNRVELARIAIASGLVSIEAETQAVATDQAKAERARVEAETELNRLETINDAVFSATGARFVRRLCDAISNILGVRLCAICVAEQDDSEKPSRFTVALSERGRPIDSIHYQLANTPAEIAMNRGVCKIAKDLRRVCPNEKPLNELGMACYIAVRLDNEQGVPTGVLAISDDKPADQPDAYERILRFFAARTASELEQIKQADELCQLRERLEDMVVRRTAELEGVNTLLEELAERHGLATSQAVDGVVILDQNGVTTFANSTFAKMLGVARSEIVGRQASEWLTGLSQNALRTVQAICKADHIKKHRISLRRPDRSESEATINLRALLEPGGRRIGSIGVIAELIRIDRPAKTAYS